MHDLFRVAKEYYRERLNIRELAVMVARDLVAFGTKHVEIYGDSAGHQQSPQSGESSYDVLLECLRLHGITWDLYVPREIVFQVDRINAVNLALKDLAGAVHVEIDSSCSRLAEDLRKVKFDDKGKIDKKNKLLTHASDAFGYWVHYVRPARVHAPAAVDRFSVSVR
jgi:hypothetical protein